MCWRLKWNKVTAASIIYFVSYLFLFYKLLDWLIILDSCAHGFLRLSTPPLYTERRAQTRGPFTTRHTWRGLCICHCVLSSAKADEPIEMRSFSTAGVSGCTVIKSGIWYDTIRDAILTCSRKPTWVSLIYPTETTTKKCKTEKLKSKNGYAQK